MRFDFSDLMKFVGQTFRDPAGVAGQIVQLRLPQLVGWLGLAIVTILSVMAISIERLIPGRPEMLSNVGGNPFIDTVFLGGMTAIFICVLFYGGRVMGGSGSFGSTLLIMTWFQTIVLVLVVVQLIAVVVTPSVAAIISLVGFGLQLWCLIHFLNVLHGFDSLGKAFGLFALSIVGFVFGLAFILLMVGGAAIIGAPV